MTFYLTKITRNGSLAFWENILPRVVATKHIPLAVKVSDTCEPVLVGDDSDPLVLLIYLADGKSIISTSEPSQIKEQPSVHRSQFDKSQSREAHALTFREQAEVARSMKSSKHQVMAADEKVMAIVLNVNQTDHVDTMIYQRFQELITTGKKAIHPNMLPPKSAGKKYHSLRVFNQVQQWQRNTLHAGDWGWELETSDTLAAPLNHFLIL